MDFKNRFTAFIERREREEGERKARKKKGFERKLREKNKASISVIAETLV
ncbi:hypothetical protein ACE1CB_15845 [Aerosakkonema sp. BLCC-F2]